MDCNRFSGPTCPLKFHDVCVKVGRLFPLPLPHPFTNPTRRTTPLFRPHISQGGKVGRGDTRIRRNLRKPFPPPRRFFPSPAPPSRFRALHLAACIPWIIRILQLLHRTVLTNKRHAVITSASLSLLLCLPRCATPGTHSSDKALQFLLLVPFCPRLAEKHSLPPHVRTMAPNGSFVGKTPSLVYIQKK